MSKIHCFKGLPAVLHIFAESVHILDFQLGSVIQRYIAAPKTVDLMRVHTGDADVHVGMVVVGGLHGKVEASVLGDYAPRLHVFIGFRECLHVHRAKLMHLAVIENAGFCGIGLVAYGPCNFKAENIWG